MKNDRRGLKLCRTCLWVTLSHIIELESATLATRRKRKSEQVTWDTLTPTDGRIGIDNLSLTKSIKMPQNVL